MTSTNHDQDRDRDDALEQARDAAQHALNGLDRLSSVVGFVGQMAGKPDEGGDSETFTNSRVTARGARDLAELLPPLVEHLRHFRVQYGSATFGGPEHELSGGLGQEWLPLNRKEQYYTATVLPLIIASDGFAHIHRFFTLCGLDDVGPFGSRDQQPGFQFFTEYNFAESLRHSDLKRFPDAPTSHDTPDLMFVGPDWIVAVEAKMFHDPNPQALNAQLGRQRLIVDYLATTLGVAPDRVHHVFLLPEGLNAEGLSAPVVTWEDVVGAYRTVGPAYWVSLLADALGRYDDLKSVSALRGQNKDADLTGAQIVAGHQAGTAEFTYMGRFRGLNGPELAKDITTGAWRTQSYEVRVQPLDAPNWFPISAFLNKLPSD
jgi:hypothetical protein